jgi:hypothetical protein
MPAIERYDGPPFRVVRKFLREAESHLNDVDIFVLSARHGLIPATRPISDYEQKMTQKRATELNPKLLALLKAIFEREYSEVFLSLGKIYLQAIHGFDRYLPEKTSLIISQSSEGRRLAELKQWLYKGALTETKTQPKSRITGRATLKGTKINATPDEVMSIARRALDEGIGEPKNFQKWYVVVDGKEVSTKWLVSILSGLKVSDFQASDARRVLRQLGFPIYQYDC